MDDERTIEEIVNDEVLTAASEFHKLKTTLEAILKTQENGLWVYKTFEELDDDK